MNEIRIIPIKRYAVLRHYDNADHAGCESIAENLTLEQAQNIAGAVHARAEAAGLAIAPLNLEPHENHHR